MNNRDKKFFDWEYLENAAHYFYGLDRIHLTGGEPTIHPKFEEFVPKLKKLFGCNRLTIETNGFLFKRNPGIFAYFDELYCTHYRADSFPGSPDNSEDIAYIKEYWKSVPMIKIWDIDIKHVSRAERGTKICPRGTSETLGYANGKLYPCCVASGLPERDTGIPLTENWRTEILDVVHPCDICFFALK